jgi:peptidoglycan/LPS O-acetylase OafA/YrhL
MYIALALTFLAVRFVHGRWFAGRKRAAVFTRALTGAALVALAWDIALVLRGHWQTDGVHLFAMFFTGAALRGRDLRALIRPLPALAVLAAVLLASLAGRQAFLAVYILALPYLVLAAALLPGGVLRQYNRLGDYSYGTYIYAFPLQQWTAALWPGVSAWQVVAVALPSSVLMGVVSWHVIEKHMLALKSRVRPRPESAPPLAQHA